MSNEDIYFEDLAPGMEAESPARTMTEADIVNFSGLSGDFNIIHTDAEFAKETPFGQRIAHGLLGLSMASGLVARSPGAERHRLVAFLGMTWDFKNPVLIGDTIRVKQCVAEMRPSKSNPLFGVVIYDASVVNQRGEVCQTGQWKVLYLKRHVE